jgi:hypothetical protein
VKYSGEWKWLEWTSDEPGDSSLIVEARDSESGPWIQVQKGVGPPLNLMAKYLEIRVTLTRATSGESPILFDLSIKDTSTTTTTQSPSCNDGNICTTDTWNSTSQKCVYTPVNCSSFSRYHQCDPNDGICKPSCPNDSNPCTVDGWNSTSSECHTPVVCPSGQYCDASSNGCTIMPTTSPTTSPPTTSPMPKACNPDVDLKCVGDECRFPSCSKECAGRFVLNKALETFSEHERLAKSHGGSLVMVQSESKMRCIDNMMRLKNGNNINGYWLGGHGTAGRYSWNNGDCVPQRPDDPRKHSDWCTNPLAYQRWKASMPDCYSNNDSCSRDECMWVWTNGEWDDTRCEYEKMGVYEIPDPTTTATPQLQQQQQS